MLRTALRSSCALGLFTAIAGLALAQAQPAPVPAPTTVRATLILGSKVSLQSGTGVGTVQDIIFSNEGMVDYLVVAEGGKLVTVPWEAAKFNYETRMATINITPEQYRQIPTFTSERYPDFHTPAYRTQVYRAYGLTPGKGRRPERQPERRP